MCFTSCVSSLVASNIKTFYGVGMAVLGEEDSRGEITKAGFSQEIPSGCGPFYIYIVFSLHPGRNATCSIHHSHLHVSNLEV